MFIGFFYALELSEMHTHKTETPRFGSCSFLIKKREDLLKGFFFVIFNNKDMDIFMCVRE